MKMVSEKSINVIKGIINENNTGVSITMITSYNSNDSNPLVLTIAIVDVLIECNIIYRKNRMMGGSEFYLTDGFLSYMKNKELNENNVNSYIKRG